MKPILHLTISVMDWITEELTNSAKKPPWHATHWKLLLKATLLPTVSLGYYFRTQYRTKVFGITKLFPLPFFNKQCDCIFVWDIMNRNFENIGSSVSSCDYWWWTRSERYLRIGQYSDIDRFSVLVYML